MASQTAGIQQLLTAEKKASEKVSEARKAKAKRLKAARVEATVEIDSYRAQMETTFKEKEQSILGSRDDVRIRMEKHKEEVIKTLKEQTKKNKEVVIDRILEFVCNVKPELHVNYEHTQRVA